MAIDIPGLVIAIVGTIAAIIAAMYAILAVRVAKRVASSQEQLQRELTSRQEVQQRRRETLQACEELRTHLDTWHRELAKNIDPTLSPRQIYDNIRTLNSFQTFQSKYQDHIGRIRAAHEPLCDPLLQKAHGFEDRVLEQKKRVQIRLSDRFTRNAGLERLYDYARRQTSEDAKKAYVEAVLEELKALFFGIDAQLDTVMVELRKQLYETP